MKKVAIVTGASGNLGKAIVSRFLSDDYQVFGIVHKKSHQADSLGNDYHEIELDLRNEDLCQLHIQEIKKATGSIDVAVLTAGGFTLNDITHTRTSDIYAQYQLNFETAYNIARPVFTYMLQQNNGHLFFIGSRAGYDISAAKGLTAYALSKSLLFRLAELMNIEARGKNVVASVVVPSIIDTPQNRKEMPNTNFSSWVLPEHIAKVISFYSSENAAAIREPVIKIYNHS